MSEIISEKGVSMSKSSLVRFKDFLANYPEGGVIIGALALIVFFSLATEHFLTVSSFRSMLNLAAIWGITAVGVALLMIGGEFDLSVGSVLGLSAVGVAIMVTVGIPTSIAVVMMLIICVAIGLVQGLFVVKFGIPSFIITMAGMMIWRGVIFLQIRGGYREVKQDDPFFQIFSYRFENVFSISVIWFVVVAVILGFILHRSRFGNWIFATGGNKQAAIQAGVPVDRVKVILFGLTAGLAGLAGIIQMTQFSMVGAMRGQLEEMYLIAMVVIGATRLSGGYGSVVGVVFGVFMMAIIQNGLSLMGVTAHWYKAVVGLVLLIAVIINVNSQKRAMGGKNE
jgi:simple sugar transport system permease protein